MPGRGTRAPALPCACRRDSDPRLFSSALRLRARSRETRRSLRQAGAMTRQSRRAWGNAILPQAIPCRDMRQSQVASDCMGAASEPGTLCRGASIWAGDQQQKDAASKEEKV